MLQNYYTLLNYYNKLNVQIVLFFVVKKYFFNIQLKSYIQENTPSKI